jgi:HD-GYP domain-containing protein (c-di-GMP phosphodiesterase class II)
MSLIRRTESETAKRPAQNRRKDLLHAVMQCATRLVSASSVDVVIPQALETIGKALRADRVLVTENIRPDDKASPITLTFIWQRPDVPVQVSTEFFRTNPDLKAADVTAYLAPLAEGKAVFAIASHAPDGMRRLLDTIHTKSILFVPIYAEQQRWGVVSIDDCYSDRTWSAAEIDSLKTFASMVGGAVTRVAAYQRIENALQTAVAALASMAEQRDPYTAGHQRRVAELAAAIAGEMGLSKDRIQGLYMASVIHDIGKNGVPAEILTKPGRLTPIEFALIQTHAQLGYDIVKGIDFPWPVGLIILQHHERLDGSGYPQGLTGREILLEAKILAVADVVEAMMAHRPHRPALGIDAALAELEKGEGRLYDPAAVKVCRTLFRDKGFKFSSPKSDVFDQTETSPSET